MPEMLDVSQPKHVVVVTLARVAYAKNQHTREELKTNKSAGTLGRKGELVVILFGDHESVQAYWRVRQAVYRWVDGISGEIPPEGALPLCSAIYTTNIHEIRHWPLRQHVTKPSTACVYSMRESQSHTIGLCDARWCGRD